MVEKFTTLTPADSVVAAFVTNAGAGIAGVRSQDPLGDLHGPSNQFLRLLLEATSSSVKVVPGRFVAPNFTSLNPGEPVISGFVTNGGAAGVAGLTVGLCNVARHLVATRRTSASGPYAVRFTAPGTYTVPGGPPPGYAAQPPVTLDVKMFDEVRVDVTLDQQQRTAARRGAACPGGTPRRPRCRRSCRWP